MEADEVRLAETEKQIAQMEADRTQVQAELAAPSDMTANIEKDIRRTKKKDGNKKKIIASSRTKKLPCFSQGSFYLSGQMQIF